MRLCNNLIKINKEASMQLQYSYILNSLIPLLIFCSDEEARVELETGVYIDGFNREIDLMLIGKKNSIKYKIAVEMKCYREYTSSGGKRGATDIFMKDVYSDLELLERYCDQKIANEGISLIMNDLERLVYPKTKSAKCWDYDISDGASFSNIYKTTPIGGKKINIKLFKSYNIKWNKCGDFWFAEIQGKY